MASCTPVAPCECPVNDFVDVRIGELEVLLKMLLIA